MNRQIWIAIALLAVLSTHDAHSQDRVDGGSMSRTRNINEIGGGGGFVGGYGLGSYGGGTVAGSAAHGMADVVRSQGQYNLLTSEAMINLEQAKQAEIRNRKEWTETYFEMRRINQEARAAERGPKGTPEDWVRYAKAAAPQRLSPGELDPVTGRITWPILLRSKEFTDKRAELDRLFAERAERSGYIGTEGYSKVLKVTSDLIAVLKENIRSYLPNDYIQAKKFLESLGYEARFASA